MNAAVAVAVHYHVHLARPGHAVIGISAEDAAIGELPQTGVWLLLVEGRPDFGKLIAELVGLLDLGKLRPVQLGLKQLILLVGVGEDLLANDFKKTNEK